VSETCTWPLPAVATGVGSMPGVEPREAMNIVSGELTDFVPLVELPERGPGADSIGRTAAMLTGIDRAFEVETTPSGWRLGHGDHAIVRRAHAYLSADIDALEEFCGARSGPVKVSLVGPWSMAAAVLDPAGEALLRDPGAVTDVAVALGHAAVELITRVRRATGDAPIVVQIDEDAVPTVLAGRVRTSSGRLTHRSVESSTVQAHLRTVVDSIHATGARAAIRCFAPAAPVDLLRGTQADALAIALNRVEPEQDALPRAWEAGIGLLLGCVPVRSDIADQGDTAVSARLRSFMSRHGFVSVPDNIAITPEEGLAGVDTATARAAIAACNRVGAVVREDMDSSRAS